MPFGNTVIKESKQKVLPFSSSFLLGSVIHEEVSAAAAAAAVRQFRQRREEERKTFCPRAKF